jgi:hypothetical protein
VVISAIATYARTELGIVHIAGVTYLQVLRIDREINNLPTWYSTAQLLVCALSIAAIGACSPQRRLAIRWWALASLVVLASMDESVRIHERLGTFTRNLTGLDLPWVVPAGALVLLILVATRAVWQTVTRADLLRFVVGAAVFAGGSVGMEVLHKLVAPAPDSLLHFALLHAEEGFEIIGVTLLLRATWLVLAPSGLLAISYGAAQPAQASPPAISNTLDTPTEAAEPAVHARAQPRSLT